MLTYYPLSWYPFDIDNCYRETHGSAPHPHPHPPALLVSMYNATPPP